MTAWEQKTGGKLLAIPHNGNLSNGRMFALTTFEGNPRKSAASGSRSSRSPRSRAAMENTRASIWDAMKRKKIYATSGPRITVRFFGGFDFNAKDANTRSPAIPGYTKGVPMGAISRRRRRVARWWGWRRGMARRWHVERRWGLA
jgi:hypothetical protein